MEIAPARITSRYVAKPGPWHPTMRRSIWAFLRTAHAVHTTGWKAAPVLVNRADPSWVPRKIDTKGDSFCDLVAGTADFAMIGTRTIVSIALTTALTNI